MRDYSAFIGQVFGKLTVVSVEKKNGCAYFLCRCACGNPKLKSVRKDHLLNHDVESCGCKYRERTHSTVALPTYEINNEIVVGTTFDGRTFQVDYDMYELIQPYAWYFDHYGYVVARKDGKAVKMHRMIMGFPDKKVDHINRDKSDNRKQNLRLATDRENSINRSKSLRTSTPIIGVRKALSGDGWEVRLTHDGVTLPYTTYPTLQEAIQHRLQLEAKYFGDYAPQKHLMPQYGVALPNGNQ